MIDWDRVDELRSEFGDAGLRELVDLFLDEVESVLARMAESPDSARYEEDMHFLKGSALNLGFQVMGDRCQYAERLAAEGRGAEVDPAGVIRCYIDSKADFMARAESYGLIRAAA